MAKIKPEAYRYKGSKRVKRVTVTVDVQRLKGQSSKFAFEACASFGRGGGWGVGRTAKSQDSREACATGKNPRKAMREALRRLGSAVGNRSGAFAGFKGK